MSRLFFRQLSIIQYLCLAPAQPFVSLDYQKKKRRTADFFRMLRRVLVCVILKRLVVRGRLHWIVGCTLCKQKQL